jgi:hypothetical protein|tara:strand:- start:102 stop:455 length:354 start_codon:yes stop_codon:yes gene_type:complete
MTISSTQLVDDGFKVINSITGGRNENETLVELDKLSGSTNESEISIANVYYDVEGTGTVELQFDNDKKISMLGIDNYGLKPSEEKIKGTGNIKITTDGNVDKFSLMLECHKEKGFSV